jgi:hypothetical protein
MSTNENVIKLSSLIAKSLATREAAEKLFRYARNIKSDTVIFDFSDVDFASRSFAHEYAKRKAIFEKKVLERNKTVTVRKMLALVSIRGDSKPEYVHSDYSKPLHISLKNL